MVLSDDDLPPLPDEIPTGAVDVGEWMFIPPEHRYFENERCAISIGDNDDDRNAEVYVAGIQFYDGSVERNVSLWIEDCDPHNAEALTSVQARTLARMLVAAADELDKLTCPPV